MARRAQLEPWMVWTAAGLGVLSLGSISYGIVTLASSGWPSEGDGCPIDLYYDVLGSEGVSADVAARAWQYMPYVRHAARYFDIEPSLLAGLVHTESKWVPTAGSGAGAVGLSQHIASTAANRFKALAEANRWPFVKLRHSGDPARDGRLRELGVAEWVDRTDPRQSVWLGAATLRSLLDDDKGLEWALAAYNAGPAAANKPSSQWPGETQNYVPGVLKRQRWYRSIEEAC